MTLFSGFTTIYKKATSSNPAHDEVYSIIRLCDKVCQWFAIGLWFSPVSSTNKTDLPRYNWNIVESGIKHHNPPPNPIIDNLS